MRDGNDLVAAAVRLREAAGRLRFAEPVTHVYNPLEYAWEPHRGYLERWGGGGKHVVFLGMNPGPWGMAQTGVPFGEVAAVRDWIGITADVGRPKPEHPKRPVHGFYCGKSEVSGRRLWGLFAERFGTAERFFEGHFVLNYCPLVFMESSGRNFTPDKLPAAEREPLEALCDRHLREAVAALGPQWVVGVGGFAEKCARRALAGAEVKITTVLHPSPASPAANRGWAGVAVRQLQAAGIWT